MTRRSSLPLLMAAAGLLGGLLMGARMWLPKDPGAPVAAEPARREVSAPFSVAAPMPAADPAGMPTLGTAARLPLDTVLRSAKNSENYRQYIQQVLAAPDAAGIRAGVDLVMMCGAIKFVKPTLGELAQRLPPDLAAQLKHRSAACEASSGPDMQQFRALSAAKKRSYDNADEFVTSRPLKGTQDELAALYRLGDAGGMAAWGLASTPEQLILIVGEEEAFIQKASRAHIYAAWQAAICERFTCDDFNARLVRCRDEASCKMSLQDIFKEGSGLDDAAWQQVLEAARRRVKALLPS